MAQGPTPVAVAHRGKLSTTENLFHLVMTCCTCGLWAFVWAHRAKVKRQQWRY